MDKCVACGEPMEHFGNHHCPEDFEKRRQMVDRRERETIHPQRQPTEAMRINYGFYLLSLRGDW